MTVAGATASFRPLSHSTLGWTAGAGVEVTLWSNWSAKFEYLYVSANGATKVRRSGRFAMRYPDGHGRRASHASVARDQRQVLSFLRVAEFL